MHAARMQHHLSTAAWQTMFTCQYQLCQLLESAVAERVFWYVYLLWQRPTCIIRHLASPAGKEGLRRVLRRVAADADCGLSRQRMVQHVG